MVHPTPNRLIGHRHSAFRQQIFDVAQAEGEPKIEPYSLVNDLRRETISAVTDFFHPLGYSATGRTASQRGVTTPPRANANPTNPPNRCFGRVVAAYVTPRPRPSASGELNWSHSIGMAVIRNGNRKRERARHDGNPVPRRITARARPYPRPSPSRSPRHRLQRLWEIGARQPRLCRRLLSEEENLQMAAAIGVPSRTMPIVLWVLRALMAHCSCSPLSPSYPVWRWRLTLSRCCPWGNGSVTW